MRSSNMDDLVDEILDCLEEGVKTEVLGIGKHDDEDCDENGEEIWRDCDFSSVCHWGINRTMGCFTFVQTDKQRWLVCPWCIDPLQEKMGSWKDKSVVLHQIANKFRLPRDIEKLILYLIR
jgi:hypothetical protein